MRESSASRQTLMPSTALVRDFFLNSRTHQSHPTHMREQSRICVAKAFQSRSCAQLNQYEAAEPTHMRKH
ncbi:hypothetical protein PIB30_109043, partial [Stylosanthes scabra]|nr:hypothetical protein [Stylosanthes scabra]